MSARILVVDDSASMRQMVAFALTSAGYSVEEAEDGAVALGRAKGARFNAVVTDVNMPNMDGLTMAEKVRGELRNTSVNIVMLTTENSPTMKERGKAAGIRGWIVKPFNGAAVLNTFKTLAGV